MCKALGSVPSMAENEKVNKYNILICSIAFIQKEKN
jgi:hypothetical protein